MKSLTAHKGVPTTQGRVNEVIDGPSIYYYFFSCLSLFVCVCRGRRYALRSDKPSIVNLIILMFCVLVCPKSMGAVLHDIRLHSFSAICLKHAVLSYSCTGYFATISFRSIFFKNDICSKLVMQCRQCSVFASRLPSLFFTGVCSSNAVP